MKKVISLFLSLAMLLSIVSVVDFSAFAFVKTGSCGNNVTYSLDTSTGVLTISGTGAMNDYSSTNSPFNYNSNIKSVIIGNGVTSIGNSAFYGCISLANVTIPNSVTSIGNSAFEGCTRLTSVTIPNSVTSIGYSAFNNCKNLISITIPSSVISIGNSVFSGCISLANVTMPNSVTSICDGAFYNCRSLTSVTIPDSVTSIGDWAFRGCTSLTSITIPDSVTSIGDLAFEGCTSLTSVTIPDRVTCISYSAFENCTSLTSITIPDSVTSIGDSAFDGCTSLISITIPDSVTSIGENVFKNCTSLTSITVPDSVTSICYSAFNGCTSLTSVTIPDSVKSISSSVFSGCTSLTSIDYNGTVSQWKSIEGYYSVSKIIKCTDGVIGNGNTVTIDNLKYKIYDNTASLVGYIDSPKNLVIPEKISYEGYTLNVTSIGESAFSNCTSLKSVNYSGTKSQWKAITIGSDNSYLTRAFIKCTDGIIGNGNTVTVDSVKYRLNDDYTAQVVSYSGTPENITILESVTYEGFTFKVTSIGSSAFKNCTILTSVTIPSSVTTIGYDVFNGCSKLKKIKIPDSVTYIGSKAFDGTAFYNTVKNWENGVLYSGNHLISAKSDVTKITVKASTVSIAAGALDNCKSLEKINVLNPKCVINCTIPKTAVIGGAEGSTAEDFAQKNNMSIDYFEECTHSDKVQVVIAATCTEQGVVQSRCADCDKLISQTFTAPLGHTMVITTPAKAPTCTENGYTQAGYCTVCGYNEVSTVIPATGHNFGSNSPSCLVCGVANPNYIAPTQPTQTSKPVAKPKSAKIKKVKVAKKAVSVQWKKVSGVKGYQIQVATDKKFKKNKKTVTVKKQKTTKITVKKLKAKKKYYVRIRTYKTVNGKKVYSSWSKVKTVKTK